MRPIIFAAVGVALFSYTPANAQSWLPPTAEQRCPSKWGVGDERGAANHMTAQTVLRAIQLIRRGEIIELGHVLSPTMPLIGTRRFDVHTKRTVMNAGANRRGSNEELVISEIGQVGTQFDGFAHQTIGDSFYNCIDVEEVATRSGFTRLGVETIGTLLTRAVMLDIAALRGVEMLPDTYEITVADLQQALQRQNLTLRPGDAVIVHTGWGRLWGVENARYSQFSPGLGIAATEWLAQQDPLLIGADNTGVSVNPYPDPQLSNPVHQVALVVHGIFLLENLKLDELAARGIHEFALILQPLKIQGGSGSTVAPVAVH